MIQQKHIRRTGFFEKQYVCRNVGRFYSNFTVSGKYGGDTRITRANLSHALRQWLENMDFWLVYNFYRCDDSIDDISADGSNFEVRPVEKLAFDSVVEFQTVASFNGDVLEWLNDVVPPMNVENSALWKVYVLDAEDDGKQYMVFVADHALLDGMCGAEFQKTMPRFLEANWNKTEERALLFDYEKDSVLLGESILGPRELMSDLFQLTYWQTAGYYLNKWAKLYLPTAASDYLGLNETINPPLFAPNKIEKSTKSKFRIVNFSAEELKGIRTLAKLNNLTLTPLVHTIALNSLEKTLVKSLTTAPASSLTCIAVNGRKYVPQTKTQGFIYGCLVSSTSHIDPPLPEITSKTGLVSQLLPRMRLYLARLQENLTTLESFKRYGGYGALTNVWRDYEQVPGTTKRCTLVNSNLGYVDPGMGPDSHFILEDCFFGSSTCLKYHVITNLISTAVGGLTVVVACLPEYEDKIDTFTADFKKSVLSVI